MHDVETAEGLCADAGEFLGVIGERLLRLNSVEVRLPNRVISRCFDSSGRERSKNARFAGRKLPYANVV